MNIRFANPRIIYLFRSPGEDGQVWIENEPTRTDAYDVCAYNMRAYSAPPNPGSVYLQPWCNHCAKNDTEGRMWCEDDVWVDCEYPLLSGEKNSCRAHSIRYDPIREDV